MPRKKQGGKPGKPGLSRPERTKRTVTYNGQELTVSEAARIVGISRQTMWNRLFLHGWDDEEAMSKQTRPRLPGSNTKLYLTVKTPDGPVKKSAKQWAEEMDGDTVTNLARICTRHSRGWSDAQALDIVPPPPRSRKARPKPSRKSKKGHGNE